MQNNLFVVVGLGITGLSVVNYLIKQGHTVAVTDSRQNPPNTNQLPKDVQTSFGQLDESLLLQASQIIISPGLSLETPEIIKAQRAGINIVGDVHILAQAIQTLNQNHTKQIKLIAITGSNAKSTVTTLVAKMAEEAGIKVAVGGNLGKPALELLDDNPELIVLEVSSFQLESTTQLSADVATILNMSADHLDRHHTMKNYQSIKHKIFDNAKSVVINREDILTQPEETYNSLSFGLSSSTNDNYGLIIDDNQITWIAKGQHPLISANDIKIKGRHNLLNAQAALALGELANIPLPAMLQTLKQFKGLPHRCEFVTNINGVDYFNDSKGTNVGSTLAAITGLGKSYQNINNPKPIHLILGGEGKGQDFSILNEALTDYVHCVYLIGRDAHTIKQAIASSLVSVIDCDTLTTAVKTIKQNANNDEVALLSPACASFDQYKSYVARGEEFIALCDNN